MQKHTIIRLNIANGKANVSGEVTLEPSDVYKCALYINGTPSSNVDVRITTARGDEITPYLPYQEYERAGGSHENSKMDIHIKGNQKIKISAQAFENLTEDFTFSMVFYHQ